MSERREMADGNQRKNMREGSGKFETNLVRGGSSYPPMITCGKVKRE